MPTIRRCCIVGCLSNSRQNPNLQFFQFPRPENPFHKMWKQACKASLSRILPFKKPVVCSVHFLPKCIGGRRLIASAVPSLRLDVPSNLIAVEQNAMMEDIERSRKCAYINAVVYEWLVRANLNPQLRGSITHGMIKEKAEEAKQIIGSSQFVADNRWLNRFRETHLTGFAQKLAANQLKPLGPSLWIGEIVQDLQHLFPPTTDKALHNFENVPKQYYDYMQQYGEYEDDDESKDQSQFDQSAAYSSTAEQTYYDQSYTKEQSHYDQSYYGKQEQSYHDQQQSYYNQHEQSYYNKPEHHHKDPHAHYDDSYYKQQQQQHHQHQQQQHHHHHHQQQQQQHQAHYVHPGHFDPYNNGMNGVAGYPEHNGYNNYNEMPQRPPSHTQSEQQLQTQKQIQIPSPANSLSNQISAKRKKFDDDEDIVSNGGNSNGPTIIPPIIPTIIPTPVNDEIIEDLTDGPEDNGISIMNGLNADKSPQSDHTINDKMNGENSNANSPPSSPKSLSPTQTTTTSCNGKSITKEIDNYAQALEYLKPLEDFALFRENFRAIGLISQLERVLRKGEKTIKMEE